MEKIGKKLNNMLIYELVHKLDHMHKNIFLKSPKLLKIEKRLKEKKYHNLLKLNFNLKNTSKITH
jgi:hypothetical protein